MLLPIVFLIPMVSRVRIIHVEYVQPTTITESTCYMNTIISIIRIIDHSFIMISKCLDDNKWSVYCRRNNKWITDKTVIPSEYYDMINVWLRECYDKTCLSVTDHTLYNDNVIIMDYLNNLPTLTIPLHDNCNVYNTKWCGNVKWLAVLIHKKQFCIDKVKTLHIANGIQWDNIYQIIKHSRKYTILTSNENDVNFDDFLSPLKTCSGLLGILKINSSYNTIVYLLSKNMKFERMIYLYTISYVIACLNTVSSSSNPKECFDSYTVPRPDIEKPIKKNLDHSYIHITFEEDFDINNLRDIVKICYCTVRGITCFDNMKNDEIGIKVIPLMTTKNRVAFKININEQKLIDKFVRELQNRNEMKNARIQKLKSVTIHPTRNLSRPKQKFNKTFRVGTWNCNSINNKTMIVKSLFDELNLDYLQLQETRCFQKRFFSALSGYSFALNGPEKDTRNYHGVMSISQFDMGIDRCNNLPVNMSLQFIEQTGNRPLLLSSVYIPINKQDNKIERQSCINKLLSIIKKYPSIPLIVGGDFNTHPKEFDTTFSSLLNNFVLCCPSQNTYFHNNASTTIDYILYYPANVLKHTSSFVHPGEYYDNRLFYVDFEDCRDNGYKPQVM